MLQVHSSNNVETLAERLGEVQRSPLASPFDPEVVMVHSRGMERWLSLQLAQRLGICAHVTFPFPAPFLTQVMIANTPGWNEQRAANHETQSVVWSLMKILPEVATHPGAEAVGAYLQKPGPNREVKLYQLAQCLAHLFDQYQIYRPTLLQRWESGRAVAQEEWQATVWQHLLAKVGRGHRMALREAFFRHLKREQPKHLVSLPSRISVFGISSLAPFYIEILSAFAHFADVHVFFLNPCQEYWGDILSRKQRARLSRRQKAQGPAAWDQMELGLSAEPDFSNELLAYFGSMGRDFFDLLLDQEGVVNHDAFTVPVGRTLLTAVQRDIFCLEEGLSKETFDREEEARNPSIQVHACHSRTREIEVLNDVLLGLFERHPDLKAREVMVMAPSIEAYTSKIHAVFDRDRSDERYMPYSVADRPARFSQSLGSVLLRLLDLQGSRWEVSEVLAILENDSVMRRFCITESGLDSIRRWVAESGVRWGRDGEAKNAWGLPETQENTWQFGLDRMVLGHAMPLHGKDLFEGVLPYDHVEGGDTEVLSNLLAFWDQVTVLFKALSGIHSVERWAEIGRDMVANFFADEADDAQELDYLYRLFTELSDSATAVQFGEEIGVSVVREYLEGRLNEVMSAGGFFTGGITFCNLLPMRSLPFRVVVLLGMSGQEFPRQDRQQAFDCIHQSPRRGDRLRKQEDRYLFLEALLAARDHMVLLYTGQSSRDNTEISTSAFVSQLQDYVQRVYQLPSTAYFTRHRLQPFSPAYFESDSEYFTYAREFIEQVPARDTEPVLIEPLEVARGERPALPIVALEDLIAFYQHPVATFYRTRFGLFEPLEVQKTQNIEPIDLGGLESWQIENWVLSLIENQLQAHEVCALMKASGLLPHSAFGMSAADHLQAGVEKFAAHAATFMGGPALEPVEFEFELDSCRLIGRLESIHADGLRQLRFGRIRPGDRYRLWVEHLVTQALPDERYRKPSAFMGRGGNVWCLQEFNTSQAALHELKQLVRHMQQGLQRPLKLFPRTSMVYAHEQRRSKNFSDSKRKAYDEWNGRGTASLVKPEQSDYYHQLAFGNEPNTLDQEFSTLSEKLVRPMLDNTMSYGEI